MKNKLPTLLILLVLAKCLAVVPTMGQGTTPQTIAWTGTTNDILALNVAHPLDATASSGLPVALRVEAGPATLANGMITVTGAGTVWVSAEQAGDGRFWPARVTRSFNMRGFAMTRSGMVTNAVSVNVDVEDLGHYAYVANFQIWDGGKYVGSGIQIIDVSNAANPRRVGEYLTYGSASDVQVVGIYAYVTTSGIWNGEKYDGSGLQIIDVSNPANPVREGSVELNGDTIGVGVAGVEVVGRYAYLAFRESGVVIIDVNDPAKPVRVGAYDTDGRAMAVRVSGKYAYVADGASGLVVLDVSNPVNPVRVGGYRTYGYSLDVDVVRNYVYVAEGDGGLEAIDVSDPAAPVRTSQLNTFIAGSRVKVSGSYAYLSGKFGLQVIDVSNPAEPLSAGVYDAGGYAHAAQVVGNIAYVAYGNAGLQILDLRLAYPQTFKWLGASNDILEPNMAYPLPTVKSGLPVTLRVDSGPAVVSNGAITVTGKGTVVVTAEQAGDAVYLPAHETRSFNVRRVVLTPVSEDVPNHDLSGVQVVGNYAYATAWDLGLEVIDITNRTSPVQVGAYDTSGQANGVQVVGNYAYVADGEAGLQIIDVSNPVNPMRAGGYSTRGSVKRVQVVGNYAYVVGEDIRLQVIDLSDPANPVRVGGYEDSGQVEDVQVVGRYAYMTTSSAGLVVVDVSNPASPVRVGGVGLDGEAYGVKVVGHYAYVGGSSLRVIDVSNPSSPVWVNESDSGSDTGGYVLVVLEQYAYLSQSWSDAQVLGVVDVSNPKRPVWIGNGRGAIRGVWVEGKYVYEVGSGGLETLQLRLGYPQTLDSHLPAEVPLQSVPMDSVATASSGLPVTISVESGPAIVVNNQLVLTGLGQVGVAAEQAGDEFFLPVRADWAVTVTSPQIRAQLIGGGVDLHWPAGLTEFKLQATESLAPGSPWHEVTASPIEADGEASLRLDPSVPQSYFRLFKP
ncbi:MAG TPA: hypothetical protein PLX89_23160 [Verrucomicrobiota bacterium]|nr:hypothetical protein [Verrucomicrobiales bacterium]HRI15908.1 hypothetical protein [Verrucomicrobiota bacterium]